MIKRGSKFVRRELVTPDANTPRRWMFVANTLGGRIKLPPIGWLHQLRIDKIEDGKLVTEFRELSAPAFLQVAGERYPVDVPACALWMEISEVRMRTIRATADDVEYETSRWSIE